MIIGIDTIINNGVIIGTNSLSWTGSNPSVMKCAYIIPPNNIIPPAIIILPIGFEPYRFDMINETTAIIIAGDTPIEINCRNFGSGSKINDPVSVDSCMKLYIVIISATNIMNNPRLATAMYFSTAI